MLMDLCLVVVTILISVPSSPNAPRPTSPMPHHLIIVDIYIYIYIYIHTYVRMYVCRGRRGKLANGAR